MQFLETCWGVICWIGNAIWRLFETILNTIKEIFTNEE